MILLALELFWTFFLIGICNFGGGGAVLSLIQSEIVAQRHWITEEQFANIVAVSQTTPGPIGINSATYVGYQVIHDAGGSNLLSVLGSASCTLAIVLPSLLIFIILLRLYSRYRESNAFSGIMVSLRPVTAGLIGAVAVLMMFRITLDGGLSVGIMEGTFPDWKSWVLAAAAFSLSMWTKVSPILIILCAGFAGLLIY